MPLYMDHHHKVEGLTAEAVAGAHQRDIEVQAKHGVNYLKYWFDEAAESDREQEIKGKKDLEMTFWSENHQAEFYQAQCLAGALFSGETFASSFLHLPTSI